MKKMLCIVLMVMMLLICTTATAQEYVSVAEVYDQAQAMGGWWKETFSSPNGEVTVNVPIIVPDVEMMPVLTVENAKISEEMFNRIAAGKKTGDKDEHQYELEMDGETIEFYLGRDNYWVAGEQTNYTGYDAIRSYWTYHGGYRSSMGSGMGTAEKQAQPTTFHYPWQIDGDAACVRNSDITLNEAMRLWHEDLALCYPDDNIEIRPTVIKLRGSTLTDATGKDKKYKRDGYLVIEGAEQLINGIPLMGTITYDGAVFDGGATAEKNRIEDKVLRNYKLGSYSVNSWNAFYGNFTDEDNYRTSGSYARVRTTEYTDVPLASLDTVLDNIRDEIEAGNIREIFSIKLGYLLYSNPEMTDYAWAIPRWEVKVDYVKEGKDSLYKAFDPSNQKVIDDVWIEGRSYFTNLQVDAQNGEPIIFSYGYKENAEIYAVPEIITWDDVN